MKEREQKKICTRMKLKDSKENNQIQVKKKTVKTKENLDCSRYKCRKKAKTIISGDKDIQTDLENS